MQNFLTELCGILWGSGLLILLLGTGVFCLFAGKFAAFRSFRLLLRKRSAPQGNHHLSAFQACTASLAAAMGTGNIAGVATALTLGGAGAIFWMWAAALVGMPLIYAENVLSCRFRQNHSGTPIYGAIAYLRHGLNSPPLAAAFAVCCTLSGFGMGNMTQSNAMADTLHAAFGMPHAVTGILAALLTGAVILGGAKRIGAFTQAVIPALSVVYLLGAGAVIFLHRENLGAAFSAIFQNAFGISAVGGGISGAAVQHAVSVGLRRGVFSNEAGLGSSGILHGDADGSPEILGVFAMCEVFLDTFLCCTATALAVLCTGVMDSGTDGAVLVLAAFRRGLGNTADVVLPLIIALFALCTLIGWGYCAGTAFAYLTNGRFLRTFRLIFCLAAAIGAVTELNIVWTLADIANAGMAYCNLPALLLLYPHIAGTVRIDCTNNEGVLHFGQNKEVTYGSENQSCGDCGRRTRGNCHAGTEH